MLAVNVFILAGSWLYGDDATLVNLPWVNRKPLVERTLVFPRTQTKYNLHMNYLQIDPSWLDRPLYFDRRTEKNEEKLDTNTFESFRKIMASAQAYRIDGFAALVGASTQDKCFMEALDIAEHVRPDGFQLLLEVGGRPLNTPEELQAFLDYFGPCLEKAIASKICLRLNGKVVVTSYGLDKMSPESLKAFIRALKTKYGDTFVIFADIQNDWHKYIQSINVNQGAVPQSVVEEQQKKLRAYLDVCDGIMCSGCNHFTTGEHIVSRVFYEKFLIPLFCGVLAEPKYKDKYLALSAGVGYHNVDSFSLQSEEGTRCLRDEMEIALKANPDIIIMPEWDEECENTCLEPTVYNSFSSQRIIKYYMHKLKKEAPTPNPGDDVSIPNMAISYRRILKLGEPLEVELLNIPDSEQNAIYTATLSLKDTQGKVVRKFPEAKFTVNKMADITHRVASEELAAYPVLIPSLEITDPEGKRRVFEDGLQYICLRPTENWNYKWVKMPLRDLCRPKEVSFGPSEAVIHPEMGVRVKGVVQCDEKIMNVNVLEDDREIYSVDPDRVYETKPDEMVLFVNWRSMREIKPFTGKMYVADGGIRYFRNLQSGSGTREDRFKTERDAVTVEWKVNSIPRGGFLIVSGKEKGTFNIETSKFKASVPLKQINERGIYLKTFEQGLTLSVEKFNGLPEIPGPILKNQAAFEATVFPKRATSALYMQVITESGKIYCSRPVILNPASKEVPLRIYSKTKREPVTVLVDATRIPDIQYDFSPSDGALLRASAGQRFWGLVGGVGLNAANYPSAAMKTAPELVVKDGSTCLQFDGIGNYVFFPKETFPLGAFNLTFEIKPTSTETQTLLQCRTSVPGALHLILENGQLRGYYVNHALKTFPLCPKIAVPLEKWSTVEIAYDLENIIFKVNGIKAAPIPCNGTGYGFAPCIFGGWGDGVTQNAKYKYFKGYLKSLRIRHNAS